MTGAARVVLRLRAATPADRRAVFEGLARSDVTDLLLGHPSWPYTPVLSWEAFCADYVDHVFDGSAPDRGRSFVLEAAGEAIGQVNHGEVVDGATELDTWLFAQRHCGRGLGTAGLGLLCQTLEGELGVRGFVLRPSASNGRAVRSYEKAGFRITSVPPAEIVARFGPDDVPDPVHLVRGPGDADGRTAAPLPAGLVTRRPATERDRGLVWDALRGAYRDVVVRVLGAWDDTAIRADFSAKWRAGGFEVVGAGDGDGEGGIGAIWTTDEGDWTRLREVFLAPAAQGRGIGTALLRDEIARARIVGRPLRLRVLRQSRAVALYTRLGFAPCGDEGDKLWLEAT